MKSDFKPWSFTPVLFAVAVSALAFAAPTTAAFAQAPGQRAAAIELGSQDSIEDALNIWEKRLTQEGLILLGYYNGFADGSFGQGTRNAVASYQRDQKRPATGRLSASDTLELSGAALGLRKRMKWTPLQNSRAGVTISYPADLLVQQQDNKLGGETIASQDSAIVLKTARFGNSGTAELDSLYNSLMNEQGSTITYQVKRQDWFIVSGTSGSNRYYSRFHLNGNEIRGYDFTWAAGQSSKVIENISVLISNGFYPFGRNPADGEPSFPTILQLAKIADAGGKSSPPGNQQQPPQQQGGAPAGNSQTAQSDDKDGVTEQKTNAMPAPKDGSLITSDGKGLRFVYHYFPPEDAKLRYAYQWAVDTHLFLDIPEIDAIDGLFVMPRVLHYVGRQCGTINAFYDRKRGAVFLCYEMVDSLLQMGQALSKGASDPKALTTEFVRDNLRFILLHESGHALIDLLDLPAVGREEDSVDQLAATMLLWHADHGESKNDLARVLQLASVWFKVNSQSSGSPDLASFADEHSLDAQRYFNLLCIVYGLDPDNNGGIVDKGMLPKERAARCPAEAAKINRSWARLLLPHFSPRFQPKNDGDKNGGGNQQAPAPAPAASGNPLEWDKSKNPFGK